MTKEQLEGLAAQAAKVLGRAKPVQITDAQMEGLAAQAANLAKKDMEQKEGGFHFLLASYHDVDKQLHRMTKIEDLMVEKLGEEWLNHGQRQCALFPHVGGPLELEV